MSKIKKKNLITSLITGQLKLHSLPLKCFRCINYMLYIKKNNNAQIYNYSLFARSSRSRMNYMKINKHGSLIACMAVVCKLEAKRTICRNILE